VPATQCPAGKMTAHGVEATLVDVNPNAWPALAWGKLGRPACLGAQLSFNTAPKHWLYCTGTVLDHQLDSYLLVRSPCSVKTTVLYTTQTH
jgi:hypothetical protein